MLYYLSIYLTQTAMHILYHLTWLVGQCWFFSALCLVPAAVLILAELHDVARDVSELQVGVAVVPEVFQQAASA